MMLPVSARNKALLVCEVALLDSLNLELDILHGEWNAFTCGTLVLVVCWTLCWTYLSWDDILILGTLSFHGFGGEIERGS